MDATQCFGPVKSPCGWSGLVPRASVKPTLVTPVSGELLYAGTRIPVHLSLTLTHSSLDLLMVV